MIRRLSIIVAMAAFGLVFASLAISYKEQHALRPLAQGYVWLVPHELGAPKSSPVSC
jgi:multicomponent Na+:H+ antiporter subunit B